MDKIALKGGQLELFYQGIFLKLFTPAFTLREFLNFKTTKKTI